MAEVRYGSLPFAEAIEYLRAKTDLPTERWDDLVGQAHDRYFVVAGASKAGLLSDLHEAVTETIHAGGTLKEFAADFEAIVAARGWTGWTGEGTLEGRAWRARVIYGTNLRTSYAAGRLSQMQAVSARRPWWRYRHNDTVESPRPQHQAWDGIVLRHDDPWWKTHYTPNGWGCRCYVETYSDEEMQRKGLSPSAAPDDGTYTHTDRNGTPHTLPKGIDYGWDHQPGATRDLIREVQAGAERYPQPIRSALAEDLGRIDLWAFPPGPGAGRVTMAPGTDVAHARTVRDAFNALPQAARDIIAAENYRVVALPRLSAGAAHIGAPSPTGMPPATTWDHISGVTTADGHILIAQETLVGYGAGQRTVAVGADLTRGTLAHEVAHAIDRVHRLSADPALRQALADDLAALNSRLSAAERLDADYVSQPPPRGPAEAVAELFARRHGVRTAPALDLAVALPRTAAVLKTLLDGLNL